MMLVMPRPQAAMAGWLSGRNGSSMPKDTGSVSAAAKD